MSSAELGTGFIENKEEHLSPSADAAQDANNYSRFENIQEDSDDENDDSAKKDDDSKPEKNMVESIQKGLALKDKGIDKFKAKDNLGAKAEWEDALKEVEEYKGLTDVDALLVSLYGNLTMISLKEEEFSKAIELSSKVLTIDPTNVKGLYRRGSAHFKSSNYSAAKKDLAACLEVDPTNNAAKKELNECNKAVKEHQKKEKAAFSSMFSKSMYEDKEKERQQKLRREELAKEKEQDEYTQSKLSRRERGLEEQTFEEWKKKKTDQAEADRKEQEEKEKAQEKARKQQKTDESSRPRLESPKKAEEEEDEDYDEEEAKIISETKAKGYCYFKNEQSSEVKSLIGDITPKALPANPPNPPSSNSVSNAPQPLPTGTSASGDGVSTSSWNHAGTWEERDMSQYCTDRLTVLCLESTATLEPGLNSASSGDNASALNSALQAMNTSLGGISKGGGDTGDAMSQLTALSATMSKAEAKVTSAHKVEGEAQIVMARGKKRHMYDFQLELYIEVVIEDVIGGMGVGADGTDKGPENKPKKFKGTIHLPEVSPDSSMEYRTEWKKSLPPNLKNRVNAAADELSKKLIQQLQVFDSEYKSM